MEEKSGSESAMRSSIMRRVYFVWFVREIVNSFSLKVAVLAVLLMQVRHYVSVKHVLGNSPSFFDASSTFHFFSSALASTEDVVRLFSVITLMIVGLIARDVAQRFAVAQRYSALVTAYN